MPNETETREKTRQAIHAFQIYSAGCSENTRRVVHRFCKERPDEAKALVEFFDVTHPGFNYLPARVLTRTVTKVRFAMEDAQEILGGSRRRGNWARRRMFLLTFVVFALALPMLLSPTHPIAVYGYLADSYESPVTPMAFADSNIELYAFLISPAQLQRYRADLLDDAVDTRTSKLFAIVLSPDGTLKQECIRTWNSFLPTPLPLFLNKWRDRKELPFLGDEVDLWLGGNEIIAIGHYHAFGGGPSAGDMRAQQFSDLPEVVVANGIVPMVYVRGKLVSYGGDVLVSEDIFRPLRPIEQNLMMDTTQSFSWSEEPSEALKSFLGFLRDYRNVDISRTDCIASGIQQLCFEFRDYNRTVFTEGYTLAPYLDDPDRFNVIDNLANVQVWAEIHKQSKPDIVDADGLDNES